MATKRRGSGSEGGGPKAPRANAEEPKRAARPATKATRPRIRASHESPRTARGADAPGARRPRRPGKEELKPRAPALSVGRSPSVRKAPLTGPRRSPANRRSVPPPSEPSAEARELALELAAAGIDKKAIGIEILDVTGKVDYADFLVIMTGRSDRHVHAIAMGLEEALRKKRVAPISMEGLGASTWVLIDFGDVVVHVFQEDARRLYDIEGLWIDASRIPVPEGAGGPPGSDF